MSVLFETPADDVASARLVVDFLGRKPFPGQFSIEASFDRFAAALCEHGVVVRRREAPVHSKGLMNRLRICAFAARRTEADVVHVTGDIQFAALTAPRPVVLTVHDLERLGRLTGIRRALFRLFWFVLPCRHADAVCVISEATRVKLLSEVPGIAHKVHVVPTLISEAFRPCEKTFNEERPMILVIGTKSNKNLPRLAEALEGLRVKLAIVGKVDSELEATFSRHGLEWENRNDLSQSEIVALYRAADIVALVSTEEGFGMPIIEAQRVGRPVLTSNVSSMPEVAGDGALLIDPFDVTSIRAGVERLVSDAELRARLVQTGFQNATRFDAKTVAGKLLSIYFDTRADRPVAFAR